MSGAWTSFVLRALEQLGFESADMCKEVGIAPELLLDPEARIPRDVSVMIWREAIDLRDDPYLVLQAAEAVETGPNNLLAHLGMSCRNLHQALSLGAQYRRLVAHGEVLGLSELESTEIRPEVTTRVMLALPKGSPDLDEIAAALHMSKRTLQRRLADEGVSFRDVVEDARRGLALEALSDGLSISETAKKIGFSDIRPIKRAFRRWTGMTPTELAGSA